MQKHYDVVIVGAGIQGAGIAQAFATNGYKTLVLEKNAGPGLETSSASSKLIHGGLRYLANYEFDLVKECLSEQRYLLRAAPSLVKKRSFYIPVYENSPHRAFTLRAGLALYSLLKGDLLGKSFSFSAPINSSKFSGLNQTGIKSILRYEDAQTDDQALTELVIKKAAEYGADIRYQSSAKSILYQANTSLFEIHLDQNETILSKTLVNATGPWFNAFTNIIEPKPRILPVEQVQGIHLLFDNIPIHECFYLTSPSDGRPIFILPWQGKTMVGTTERIFTGDPSDQHILDDDIDYLTEAAQYYFPALGFSKDTLSAAFSGLRILPKTEEKAGKRSRETLFATDNNIPGYLGICGGKLTNYRATAWKALQTLCPHLPCRDKLIDTMDIRLE